MEKHSFIINSEFSLELIEKLSFLNISILEESVIEYGIFEVLGKKESVETLKRFLNGDNTVV